ncbi:2-oxo acid dehydrogenase subunit E2 [Engelhardtia mirabilis]|uniref:Dihydrolipoamide acetyltransferase component of pyruvate dehydrogenase complex n=1 Tax=Engelhardtia mirabilis TaxID=2528011 RepID=A0A518BRL0_9BACT|nr:Dihydrolipoyllysine-residue acetyltransferase component of pyruvate dehydrogenase complex [Planctomycetes bacterium Pla133]QDV03916.1 Dihydrolipoyllysine-residue acetyltransferase component of pyruvate dehydrogenase complex [Planctomycetes bacterium Pla86]
MALEFKLPDIGEGIAEGEIVKWLVAAGDVVEEHQAVVEVMTDKATVEVPSPAAGTIAELRAGEGDVVPVGDVIFVLETSGGGSAAASAPASAAASAAGGGSGASGGGGTATVAAPAAATGGTLEFKLPDIGEGIAEGEIVKWLVAAGDAVDEHQAVVEVMTDKATVEVPSPAAGTIGELRANEGDVVPVGSVIFVLQTAGGGSSASAPAAAAPAAAPAKAAAAAAPSSNGAHAPIERPGGKVLAVPSARRVARDLGIDLSSVPGSGRNGVIRRADVEAFASGGSAAPAAATTAAKASVATKPAAASPKPAPVSLAPTERETRIPFRGVRRKIAEAMSRSMYTAPHFTVVEELDVTELVAVRARAKDYGAKRDIKVTYMPFIMKAAALALRDFPMLNAKLDESTNEIVRYNYVDLGIATDTPNGLIVPVIRGADSKAVLELASDLNELAGRTREGKVKPEELSGSTFSITNAGNIGGILATPIINFPEVAILGVHRIVKRPGVVETPDGDVFEVRHYMNLSCSVDHRLADGADGARFLVRMKELLEDPVLLAL